jgi:uncharacterized protein (UPF0335 family)
MYAAKSQKEDDQDQDEKPAETIDTVAGARLKSFIERVEKLESEKADIAEGIKDLYTEAKGVGFDVKTIRKIIKLRKMDAQKRAEEQMMLETYANAVQLSLI